MMLLWGAVISYETLQALASTGSFLVALFGGIYAYKQYENHKDEERIKLLCGYNERYSKDKNIEDVVTWMLNIAEVDTKGNVIGANPYIAAFNEPGIHKKEMFMRFFEELYLHIESGKIDKTKACLLFSYYAIEYDKHFGFRMDITDYKTDAELKEMTDIEEKNRMSLYWINFRKFVCEMNLEWEKLKKTDKS